MKAIPVIQYLLPHGEKKETQIERPYNILKMAEEILETGEGNFAIEMLTTGEVSFTFETEEEDLAIRVCKNGPELMEVVDSLIKEVHEILISNVKVK